MRRSQRREAGDRRFVELCDDEDHWERNEAWVAARNARGDGDSQATFTVPTALRPCSGAIIDCKKSFRI